MRVNARKTPRMIFGKPFMFDSAHEADVCFDLALEQQAGEIHSLQFHPEFVFLINEVKIGSYKPDATYIDKENKTHVIDAKGFKRGKSGKLLPRVDRDFSLRRNLMRALFGLDVEIR